jgi:hypothetical protein
MNGIGQNALERKEAKSRGTVTIRRDCCAEAEFPAPVTGTKRPVLQAKAQSERALRLLLNRRADTMANKIGPTGHLRSGEIECPGISGDGESPGKELKHPLFRGRLVLV